MWVMVTSSLVPGPAPTLFSRTERRPSRTKYFAHCVPPREAMPVQLHVRVHHSVRTMMPLPYPSTSEASSEPSAADHPRRPLSSPIGVVVFHEAGYFFVVGAGIVIFRSRRLSLPRNKRAFPPGFPPSGRLPSTIVQELANLLPRHRRSLRFVALGENNLMIPPDGPEGPTSRPRFFFTKGCAMDSGPASRRRFSASRSTRQTEPGLISLSSRGRTPRPPSARPRSLFAVDENVESRGPRADFGDDRGCRLRFGRHGGGRIRLPLMWRR